MIPNKLGREAWDFASDLLTIQQSPPSSWPRGLLLGLVTLTALLLIWACVAELDVVASSHGRLVPLTYTKIVQPAETGVVLDVLVKDGEFVKANQVLLRLDPQISQSEIASQARDVSIKKLTLQRVEAELDDKAFVPLEGAPPDVAAQVATQYRARRLSFQDAIAQEIEAFNKAKADLVSAEQILSKLQQTVPLYQRTANAYAKLFQEGFVGEVTANEKKREFLEREQDLKAQSAAVGSLQAVIAGVTRRSASIKSNYRSQLENERIDLVTQLNKSSQDLRRSEIRSQLLEIKSPTDGIIKDLSVLSKGSVIQAGVLLLNIVPREEPVQAEIMLSNEDVGFVRVGQAAQIKVATYPFQKYGLMSGKVIYVSADAADPKQQNAQQLQLAYRALVELDSQGFKVINGDVLPLSAGMSVIAEVHQGKRTVMEYLLSPIQKVQVEAARER